MRNPGKGENWSWKSPRTGTRGRAKEVCTRIYALQRETKLVLPHVRVRIVKIPFVLTLIWMAIKKSVAMQLGEIFDSQAAYRKKRRLL
jgi:hypothetical protein